MLSKHDRREGGQRLVFLQRYARDGGRGIVFVYAMRGSSAHPRRIGFRRRVVIWAVDLPTSRLVALNADYIGGLSLGVISTYTVPSATGLAAG